MMHIGVLRAAHEREQLILFVGAGVSQSLGFPPWSEPIDHMARELGYKPEEYRQYGSALAQWGIETISPDTEEDPSTALAAFLEELVGEAPAQVKSQTETKRNSI